MDIQRKQSYFRQTEQATPYLPQSPYVPTPLSDQASTKGGRRQALPLVRQLCTALAEQNITYCHWKSNDVLYRSATGENDLDLLVSRADAERCTAVLHQLGFKAAEEPTPWCMPGILDYYGYDEHTEQLVHAHIHYQLILGEDMTKNYHLPLEKQYLATAVQGDLFKTPAPEFELIIFVIRMILKHATWDTIVRWGKLDKAEKRELAYLQERADPQRLHQLLQEQLPMLEPAFFTDCIAAIQGHGAIWQRAAVGQQLKQRLAPYARRPEWVDVGLRFWRRGILAWRRRFSHLPRKRLARSGALIAIVGGDGSGKSTAVETAFQWLASEFEVHKVHLGKPPWSLTTIVLRALLKLGRIVTATPYVDWADVLYAGKRTVPTFALYCLALRALCLSRDLYWAYSRARRLATNGELVICDRFPLAYLTWMEAVQIEHLIDRKDASPLLRWLARREKEYYQSLLSPEVLIVLRIDPTVAAERRADEDPIPVLARNQEIWTLDWAPHQVKVLDAARPLAEISSRLKAAIWVTL